MEAQTCLIEGQEPKFFEVLCKEFFFFFSVLIKKTTVFSIFYAVQACLSFRKNQLSLFLKIKYNLVAIYHIWCY